MPSPLDFLFPQQTQQGLQVNPQQAQAFMPMPQQQQIQQPVMPPQQPPLDIGRLLQDPSMQQALINFGGSLMQPIPPGGSPAGSLGSAMMIGSGTYTGAQNRALTQDLQRRKIETEEKRTDLEGRQVRQQELSGETARKAETQRMEHNAKLFPITIKKIDQEISSGVSRGVVDEAQAEFLRQRARLYPQEVNAELARSRASELGASAAMLGAEKKSTELDIMQVVAEATAKAEGIPVEEAMARLGGARYGRSQGAGAQGLREAERVIRQANPIQANEAPEAYQQRVAGLVQKHMQTKKADDRSTSREKFLRDNPYFARTPEDAARQFDELNPPEQPAAAQPASPALGKNARERFVQDTAMRGNKLGKETANGIEVLGPNGKIIGYYR